MDIILASQSPRRREQLERMGVEFRVVTPDIDELMERELPPDELVRRISAEKARAVAAQAGPDAIVIAHKVTDACRAMKDLMVELPNYRKSKTLRELVIQINTIESEADELYINAMRNLHVNGKDPLEVIAWRDVYAFLEYCADCCENVADVVDSIVMKNS